MKKLKILFIHHSTGGLLLRFGNLRKLLYQKENNVELWDHGYNLYNPKLISYILPTFHTGLSDKSGKMTGKDFNIVIDNNSPKGYADIFSRNKSDFTLKNILNFDVVIFKNCFPTTRIENKEKLEELKNYYTKIIKSVSKYPNLFIIFTPPPLRKENTKKAWAENARELANWMTKQELKNVKIFNFFNLLADEVGDNANMLKREYCFPLIPDSHPNIRANKTIGPIFVDFLISNLPKSVLHD